MQRQNGKSRKNKLKSENSTTFFNSIKLVREHVASFLPRVQDNTAWLTEHSDGGTFLMDV